MQLLQRAPGISCDVHVMLTRQQIAFHDVAQGLIVFHQ